MLAAAPHASLPGILFCRCLSTGAHQRLPHCGVRWKRDLLGCPRLVVMSQTPFYFCPGIIKFDLIIQSVTSRQHVDQHVDHLHFLFPLASPFSLSNPRSLSFPLRMFRTFGHESVWVLSGGLPLYRSLHLPVGEGGEGPSDVAGKAAKAVMTGVRR